MKNKHRRLWLSVLLLIPLQLFSQLEMVYNTNLIESRSIKLHLSGTVDVSIDWGDGSHQEVTSAGHIEHIYLEDGVYNVSLTGSLSWLGSESINPTNAALEGVLQFGDLGITSLKNAFKYAANIQYVPVDLPSSVLNLSGCFSLIDMERIENLDLWNVGHVTDMSNLFYNSVFFNQDIGKWDVGAVTNMNGMFSRCLNFNQDIGNWDVTQVTDMGFMFYNAEKFNQDISNWEVINVSSLRKTFSNATQFNQDIGSWDVSNVTNMHGMFMMAHMFNQDIGGWDVSQVITMDYMFFSATSINLDLSEWCVEKIPEEPLNFLVNNPYQEENINLPFWGCSCTNMKLVYEINSTTGLTLGIDLSDTVDVRIHWGDGTFEHIISEGYYEHEYAEFGYKKVVIDGKLTHFGTNYGKQFLGLIKVASFGDLQIRSLKNAFNRADSLLSVPRNLPPTITDLSNCFYHNDRISIVNLDQWDVSQIENMHHMFSDANNFNQDISAWDVSRVNRMDFMFHRASRFNQDIGDWDVGLVQNMVSMFDGAIRFNQNISGWCVESISSEPPQFSDGCLLIEEYKPFWSIPCDAIKLVYNTRTIEGSSIGLKLSGEVNAIIDWGDLSKDTLTTPAYVEHTYTHNGIYRVSIKGQASIFSSEIPASKESALVHAVSFGNMGILSLQEAFKDANNLLSVPDTLASMIQNLSGCFSNLSQDSIINLDLWDVSHVTDMSRMFDNSVNFNQDINIWDVGNVNDMSYMFYNAQNFDQPLDDWNTSAATDMNHMFFNAKVFNQDIGSWDVSQVTDMSHMFSYAHLFDQDIGSWDVSQVTSMASMFSNECAFNQDISKWDVGLAEHMHNMFYKAYLFNQPLREWNVSQVNDMSGMFMEALSFNQDIGNWDVRNVSDMRTMFYDASSFNQDLSEWCVSHMPFPPMDFSNYCPLDSLFKPQWGEACVEGILSGDVATHNLIVYPNPVETLLFIEYPNITKGPFVVELYNTYGQLVKRMSGNYFPLILVCSELRSGLYFLKITDSMQFNYRSEIIIKK